MSLQARLSICLAEITAEPGLQMVKSHIRQYRDTALCYTSGGQRSEKESFTSDTCFYMRVFTEGLAAHIHQMEGFVPMPKERARQDLDFGEIYQLFPTSVDVLNCTEEPFCDVALTQ
jgi:hypothetical protein